MRSIKLLAAMAVVAALVAGPVMAQTADTAPAMDSSKPAKHHVKKAAKKHHHAKKAAAAPAAAPAEAPAAQ